MWNWVFTLFSYYKSQVGHFSWPNLKTENSNTHPAASEKCVFPLAELVFSLKFSKEGGGGGGGGVEGKGADFQKVLLTFFRSIMLFFLELPEHYKDAI